MPALTEEEVDLSVDAGRMAATLLLVQFVPLGIGLALRQWRPAWAEQLRRPANRLSLVLNLTLFALIVGVRNVGVCLVVVTAAFAGTRAVGAVAVFALFQTLVMQLPRRFGNGSLVTQRIHQRLQASVIRSMRTRDGWPFRRCGRNRTIAREIVRISTRDHLR